MTLCGSAGSFTHLELDRTQGTHGAVWKENHFVLGLCHPTDNSPNSILAGTALAHKEVSKLLAMSWRWAFPVTAVGTGWARMVFGQLGMEVATQRWGWMEGQTLETTQQQCPGPARL